jgi:hypothetical protein
MQKGVMRFSGLLLMFAASAAMAQKPVDVPSGWMLQDVAKVPERGEVVSTAAYASTGWYPAVVPGTVLTTLVKDGIYPEPTYGENERPESIPESLNKTSYWYRTALVVPSSYVGRHVWLNFDGINYTAEVWVNGDRVGRMKGAFARGRFDVTKSVKPGQRAVLAVLVTPQPHPGVPIEHTVKNGIGHNGGITAIDGPTFLSTIGWDWLPAVRDRDTGIWQKVFLSSTGPVELSEPLVTTDLPLPKTDSADVAIGVKIRNLTDAPQVGVLAGTFGTIRFERRVALEPGESQVVHLDPTTNAALHVLKPKLWWPNGYGAQDLYKLHLSFVQAAKSSDDLDVSFGMRKIAYSVADSDNLTISVNGVKVFIRGGNWGLDEALKRIPRERLEAQFRMHQLANLNLIRNWVGQSTSEDFYEMADKYGMLLWDEFFQPNPLDGPNPEDMDTYVANVREKILRFRNHPSIAIWCARNEGLPPPEIDAALRKVMKELEPTRLYQPSSTDGRGVKSGGPYAWRTPREFYKIDAPFKTETGSMSIPTLESVHGMMPQKDWETINDDWAQHDFARGAQQRDTEYRGLLDARYGKVKNLADFVRKGQMMNYEAYRAMYEGREAALFAPTTAVITWMSSPAQPSFVWQLYHYDLEAAAPLYAVKKACEQVHVMMNEATGELLVVNELPKPVVGAVASVTVFAMDGAVKYAHESVVDAAADTATGAGRIALPENLSAVYFVKLELHDAKGKLLSDNFYWRAQPQHQDDLTALDSMATVTLDAKVRRSDLGGKSVITVTLKNPTTHVALMAHVQLRRKSGERVLPAFASDNYVSLVGGESRTIALEAATKELKGEDALVVVDGWNVSVGDANAKGVAVQDNVDAQVSHWPTTGLPLATNGLRE